MIRRVKPVMYLVVILAAFCCLVASTASAAKSPPKPPAKSAGLAQAATPQSLQYAGTLEGVEQFYTQQSADAKVQQAINTGLNTIRVRLLWDWSSHAPSRNTSAVCNLAHSAQQQGLKAVILSLEPNQSNWPLISDDMGWFQNNLQDYDKALFDPGSECISHPSPVQFMWMIGNEPNVQRFCNGADKDPKTAPSGLLATHKACAHRMALLYHASYQLIRSEKSKYNVDLKMIAGGLSSNDAPLDILADYFQDRRSTGLPACGDMDYFGSHPYPYKPQENGPYFGFKQEPKLAAMFKANGCNVPIIYTEAGFTTRPPADGSHPCDFNAGAVLDEQQFTQTLANAMAMTLNQGVIGYINMQLNDEACRKGGWSSGFYYSDGSSKPYLGQVRQIFQNALNPSQQRALP